MRDQLAKLRKEYDADVKAAETTALKKVSGVCLHSKLASPDLVFTVGNRGVGCPPQRKPKLQILRLASG